MIDSDDRVKYTDFDHISNKKITSTDFNNYNLCDDLENLESTNFSLETISHCLKSRFDKFKFITKIGDNVLININPCSYENYDYSNENLINEKIAKMIDDKINDSSILIIGESGSGKTELSKKINKCLLNFNKDHSGFDRSTTLNNFERLKRKFCCLQDTICTIFEVFGNALTTNNKNSSRFIQQISFYMNNTTNFISGIQYDTHLLSTSRLFQTEPFEQTFHCFYSLIYDFEIAKKFNLVEEKLPSILNLNIYDKMKKNFCKSEEPYVKYQMSEIVLALKNLNIDYVIIINILVLILYLSSIEVIEDTNENYARPMLRTPFEQELNQHFNININELTEIITVIAINDTIKFRSCAESRILIHNIISQIYKTLFSYLTQSINHELGVLSDNVKKNKKIIIFDMYGFEVLKYDIASQDCFIINYVNEILNNFFIKFFVHNKKVELRQEGLIQDFDSTFVDLSEERIEAIKEFRNHIVDTKFLPPNIRANTLVDKIEHYNRKSYIKKKNLNIQSKELLNSPLSINYLNYNDKNVVAIHMKHFCKVATYPIAELINDLIFLNDSLYMKITNKINDLLTFHNCFMNLNKNVKESKAIEKSNIVKVEMQIQTIINILENSDCNYIACFKPNQNLIPKNCDHQYLQNAFIRNGLIELLELKRGHPIETLSIELIYKIMNQNRLYSDQSDLQFKLIKSLVHDAFFIILNDSKNSKIFESSIKKQFYLGKTKLFFSTENKSVIEKMLQSASGFNFFKKFRTIRLKKIILSLKITNSLICLNTRSKKKISAAKKIQSWWRRIPRKRRIMTDEEVRQAYYEIRRKNRIKKYKFHSNKKKNRRARN